VLARLVPQAAEAIPALMDLLKDERPEYTKRPRPSFKLHVRRARRCPLYVTASRTILGSAVLPMCLAGMVSLSAAALRPC